MHGNGGDVGLHARVADMNFIYPNYVMISTRLFDMLLVICVLLAISIFFP